MLFNLCASSTALSAGRPTLDEGVENLRWVQEKHRQALHLKPKRSEEEVLKETLDRARLRESQSVRQGDFIREGINKYPAALEELRWKRTRDIIERIVPGVDEEPVLLEMLARQAASVEIILRREYTSEPSSKAAAILDRVVLGTVPNLTWEAETKSPERKSNYSIIIISTGLMSYLYQTAKAVVLSWPQVSAPPGATYSFGTQTTQIDQHLKTHPDAQELLYEVTSRYLFQGFPGPTESNIPPVPYTAPLAQLVTHAERFVIAHEYSHGLFNKWESIEPESLEPIPGISLKWTKELLADSSAFSIAIVSARELERRLPPNVALQGGIFALSAHDLLRRAKDAFCYGHEQQDLGSESHPPTYRRIKQLQDLYRLTIAGPTTYTTPNGQRVDLSIEGALVPMKTLDLLWRRIEGRFVQARDEGRRLHPIWGKLSRDCPVRNHDGQAR
jgi:hypothetical protein